MQQETKTINEAKLQAFMGKVVEDLAATFSSAMVIIGDKLGGTHRRQPEPGGTPLLGWLDSLLHSKRAGFWWHGAWKPGDRSTTARGMARRRLERFQTGNHDPV
jgi:hypothetical protein